MKKEGVNVSGSMKLSKAICYKYFLEMDTEQKTSVADGGWVTACKQVIICRFSGTSHEYRGKRKIL